MGQIFFKKNKEVEHKIVDILVDLIGDSLKLKKS